ncbi:MAG: extracellular solute-binding protein [Chloroflexi bacterium]|nr:extracellular solute-binding protein [Chloroflexota bacterium]
MTRYRAIFALVVVFLLALSPVMAQDEPVIYIYNNSGTLQFDAGGSDPDVLQQVQDLIAKESGVRPVTIIPSGTGADQLNLLLGSSDPIDLFQTPGNGWQDYEQAIIPITDLLQQYGQNLLSVIPADQWEIMKNADGEIMGIPRSTPTSPYITWVRQDWLDKLGLPVPKTLDELETTIQAFKAFNPDSFVATRGASGDLPWATVGGFTPNGYSNWQDPADGKVKPWIMQPGVLDWVTKMNDWWEKGYFYADTFTSFDEPEVFRTCNVGVWMGWYSRITLITPQIESACDGIAWTRTSITTDMGYIATVAPESSVGYVVTRKAKNPAAVIQFMDWVYNAQSADNQLIARYGIPEKMWWYTDKAANVVDRDPKSGYVSEYMLPNLNIEIRYSVLDPARAWHLSYLANQLISLDDAKMPFDATVPYNKSEIADQVPSLGDLNRLISEQTVLFITGQRPLDQWNDFMSDLDRAGMQDWVNALTTQYNELTSS